MKTTAVLTLELSPELRERLAAALRRRSDRTVQEIADRALREWLARDEERHAE